jgi:hypothetical protein
MPCEAYGALRVHLVAESSCGTVVGDDMCPFLGIGPGNDRNHWLRIAEVENLMRNAGLDINEVARRVVDRLLQTLTIFMSNSTCRMYNMTSNPT